MRRDSWLRRAWGMGIIHSVAGMIIVVLLMALMIILAGVYQ